MPPVLVNAPVTETTTELAPTKMRKIAGTLFVPLVNPCASIYYESIRARSSIMNQHVLPCSHAVTSIYYSLTLVRLSSHWSTRVCASSISQRIGRGDHHRGLRPPRCAKSPEHCASIYYQSIRAHPSILETQYWSPWHVASVDGQLCASIYYESTLCVPPILVNAPVKETTSELAPAKMRRVAEASYVHLSVVSQC